MPLPAGLFGADQAAFVQDPDMFGDGLPAGMIARLVGSAMAIKPLFIC